MNNYKNNANEDASFHMSAFENNFQSYLGTSIKKSSSSYVATTTGKQDDSMSFNDKRSVKEKKGIDASIKPFNDLDKENLDPS